MGICKIVPSGGGVPQEALNEIWSYIFNKDHPVKSYYISDDSTNPASIFGMGTWSLVAKDRFLIGAGSSYSVGSTGGEAKHTLTLSEIPSHQHNIATWNYYGNTPKTGIKIAKTYDSADGNGCAVSNLAGGGAAHNNIPPYYATYIWRRTA